MQPRLGCSPGLVPPVRNREDEHRDGPVAGAGHFALVMVDHKAVRHDVADVLQAPRSSVMVGMGVHYPVLEP